MIALFCYNPDNFSIKPNQTASFCPEFMVYRPTKNPPVTEKTTLKNARLWLNIVRFGESGSVIQLQDDCEYRVSDILEKPKILKKILGPYYRKYLLKYVSYNGLSLEKSIKHALIELLSQRNLPIPQNLEQLSINQLLDFIAREGFEVGLFIGRITPLLNESGFQSLINLELILQKSKNLSVLLFFEHDVTHPDYNFLTDKCFLIFDNIIKFPLYLTTDSRQFIRYQTELWEMKLNKGLEEEIIRLSGGYLWIIASLLRFFRDNPGDIDKAINDELLIKKLDIIWNKFTQNEKKLINNCLADNWRFEDNLTPEFGYLEKIGILTLKNKKVTLQFPLLKQIVIRESKIHQLRIENKDFYLNKRVVTKELTKNEGILLYLLLKNQKSLVSRQKIANLIGGNNWEEKYSDWAIDRLVYRLRRKFRSLGMDPALIKTLKKKGFRYG